MELQNLIKNLRSAEVELLEAFFGDQAVTQPRRVTLAPTVDTWEYNSGLQSVTIWLDGEPNELDTTEGGQVSSCKNYTLFVTLLAEYGGTSTTYLILDNTNKRETF